MYLDDDVMEQERKAFEAKKFASKEFSTVLLDKVTIELNSDAAALKAKSAQIRLNFLRYIKSLIAKDGPLSAVMALRDTTNSTFAAAGLHECLGKRLPEMFGTVTVQKLPAAPNGKMSLDVLRGWWARLFAIAIVNDFLGVWPWRLSDWPVWQVGVMLDLRPGKNKFPVISLLYKPDYNGLDIQTADNKLYYTDYIYYPLHEEVQTEARFIHETYKPKTAQEACFAVTRRMRDTRFVHGYEQYYSHLCPKSWDPPDGVLPCDAGATWNATFAEMLMCRWGGCLHSSRYMAIVLRAMNIPAVTTFGRLVGAATTTNQFNLDGGLATVSRSDVIQDSHTTVMCLGADLGLSHGDDALYSLRSKRLTGLGLWKPARVLYWASEVETLVQTSQTTQPLLVARAGLREELLRAASKWSGWSTFSDSYWNNVLSITTPNSEVMSTVCDNLQWPCSLVREPLLSFPVGWPMRFTGIIYQPTWKAGSPSNLPDIVTNKPSIDVDKLKFFNVESMIVEASFDASAKFALLSSADWSGMYGPAQSDLRELFIASFSRKGVHVGVGTGAWASRVVCAALLYSSQPTAQNLLQLQWVCGDIAVIGSPNGPAEEVFSSSVRLQWDEGTGCNTASDLMNNQFLATNSDTIFTNDDWNIQIRQRFNVSKNTGDAVCELNSTQFLVSVIELAVRCLIWEAKWRQIG